MSSLNAGVRLMLSQFDRMARPLRFVSNSGALVHEFRGVLRSPTPEEIEGGLSQSARVVVARAASFTSSGITPAIKDSIVDPEDGDRRYSIEWDPSWLYAGSSRLWWRSEVVG